MSLALNNSLSIIIIYKKNSLFLYCYKVSSICLGREMKIAWFGHETKIMERDMRLNCFSVHWKRTQLQEWGIWRRSAVAHISSFVSCCGFSQRKGSGSPSLASYSHQSEDGTEAGWVAPIKAARGIVPRWIWATQAFYVAASVDDHRRVICMCQRGLNFLINVNVYKNKGTLLCLAIHVHIRLPKAWILEKKLSFGCYMFLCIPLNTKPWC